MSGILTEYGGYTDDEIACGLPFALASGYWPGDEPIASDEPKDPSLNVQQQFIVDKFVLELSKALYPLSHLPAIQQASVKKLLHYGLAIAIRRYGKKESLPRRYQLLAQQRVCLTFLLHDFFLRVENMTVTPALNQRIETVTRTLAKKDNHNLAYQRVGQLRAFIYHEVEQVKGPGHGLKCPREPMRQLLSTARLYLCLNELTADGISDLANLQKRYIAQAAIEYTLPTANQMPDRKNIHRWRYRHQHSIIYFLPKEIRLALLEYINKQALFAVTAVNSLAEYKEQMIADARGRVMRYLALRHA